MTTLKQLGQLTGLMCKQAGEWKGASPPAYGELVPHSKDTVPYEFYVQPSRLIAQRRLATAVPGNRSYYQGRIDAPSPYFGVKNPEIAKRIALDLATMKQQGWYGKLEAKDLDHAHMFDHPKRGKGIMYHTRETSFGSYPDAKNSYRNIVSYLNEKGVRTLGPAGYKLGIEPYAIGATGPRTGYTQIQFRPPGATWGGKWGQESKATFPPPWAENKDLWANEAEYTRDVNRFYPRPEKSTWGLPTPVDRRMRGLAEVPPNPIQPLNVPSWYRKGMSRKPPKSSK